MKVYMLVIFFFFFVFIVCLMFVILLNNEDFCVKLVEGEYFKNNWIWDLVFKEY